METADVLVGQQRALDAIKFGTRIGRLGFNMFVIGPSGMRAQSAVEPALQEAAGERRRPSDWVYVNNFVDPHKPVAIELPAGRAGEFRDGMRALIDDLKTAVPSVFESEDYQTRRGAMDQAFQSKQGEAFVALNEKAAAKDIAILRTPMGFALAPAREGKPIPPEESGPGRRKNARKSRPPSESSRRTSSTSCVSFRNGRRSGATRFAN